jgi:hypothetical protein
MEVVVVGEDDFGGGDLGKEGEGGVDVGLVDVGHGVGLEPEAEEAGEEGGVEGFEGGGDLQAAVGGDGGVGLDPGVGELGEEVVIAGRVGGEADEGGGDVAIEGLIEAGQDVVAEAVATVGGGGVGGVLAEAEFVEGDVGVDIGAAPGEEGAVEDEAVVEGLRGFHACETGEAGAAAGVGEDGFGLVFSVMGKDDMGGAVFGGGFLEERVAGLAGGGFEGEAPGFGEGGDIGPGDLAGQAVFFGEAADEGGVLIGLFAAQGVIEVANDPAAMVLLEEPVEEDDGVAPAGDGDEGRGRKTEA